MTPQRVQRTRTKGLKGMPDGAIYVGRPSRWGNPAVIGEWASVGGDWRRGERLAMSTFIRTAEDAVVFFRLGLKNGGMVVGGPLGVEKRGVELPSTEEIRSELAGHALACWCPLDQPWCHANELLLVANGGGS